MAETMRKSGRDFETREQRSALQQEIEAMGPWFHNLHLPDGTQTAPDHPLGDFPAFKWKAIAPSVPEDLTGWKVLDIGCNAGFFSFRLAERGAEVTAIDLDPHYLRHARWAAPKFGLEDRVTFRQMQIYDLAHTDETFDLVWFMGVFYHLRYPLLALDIMARKTNKLMMFQTMTLPGMDVIETPADLPLRDREQMLQPGWPMMAFIEHRLANDPTNWWAANHACIEAMLRSSGFVVRERPCHEVYLCERAPGSSEGIASLLEDEYRAAIGQSRSG